MQKIAKETIISSSDDQIYVDTGVLRNFMEDVFINLDVPVEHAKIIADVLITSDLRGIDSHGIQRCKMYYDRIREGIYNPKTEIEIISKDKKVIDYEIIRGKDSDLGKGQEFITQEGINGCKIKTYRIIRQDGTEKIELLSSDIYKSVPMIIKEN